MAEITLAATKRDLSNKSAKKELRRNGVIPCIYYLKGKDPIMFSAKEVALKPLVFTSETHIINLLFENEEPMGTIIKDIQFDPVTDRIVHIDFLGVTLGQKLEIQIPINFVGSAIGAEEGGILQELLHKLDVECLPRHIPENLAVDVSDLSIGNSIHVRDLEFENITILNHEDTTVVSVITPRVEEVEEVEEVEDEVEDTEAAEPEVIAKGKAEEEENK